jgi:hypothetical protein
VLWRSVQIVYNLWGKRREPGRVRDRLDSIGRTKKGLLCNIENTASSRW